MSLMFLTLLASHEASQGFASMSCSVMMCPKNFPRGTPKVHFSVFRIMLNRLSLLKVSSRSVMRLLPFWDFMMMSST
jgi:hypothetical protein